MKDTNTLRIAPHEEKHKILIGQQVSYYFGMKITESFGLTEFSGEGKFLRLNYLNHGVTLINHGVTLFYIIVIRKLL